MHARYTPHHATAHYENRRVRGAEDDARAAACAAAFAIGE